VKFGIVGEHQVLTDEFAYLQSGLHETETGLISCLKIVPPRIVDARKTRAVGLIKKKSSVFVRNLFRCCVYFSKSTYRICILEEF
jgi:hypothetical protein